MHQKWERQALYSRALLQTRLADFHVPDMQKTG